MRSSRTSAHGGSWNDVRGSPRHKTACPTPCSPLTAALVVPPGTRSAPNRGRRRTDLVGIPHPGLKGNAGATRQNSPRGWIDGRRGSGTGAVAADRGRTATVQRVTPPSRSLQSYSVLL